MICYDIYILYLTAIGLKPGGSSTVHIYTRTVHKQNTTYREKEKINTQIF
jgi:hypothetical protein